MAKTQVQSGRRLLLGIEGGGTRTVAVLADERGRLLRRVESGPANLKLLSDAQLVAHFRSLARQLPKPAALGIGLAGVRTRADAGRVRKAAARVWPGLACHVTDDLETALAAGEPKPAGESPAARVLILSGTGSCCYGRSAGQRSRNQRSADSFVRESPQRAAISGHGCPRSIEPAKSSRREEVLTDGGAKEKTAKIGGWGHLLGDAGSAYQISLNALKAMVQAHDQGDWPKLGQTILRSLLLNEPEMLVDWAQRASKTDIAALAVAVFEAWRRRDPLAAGIVIGAANSLAADGVACAEKLAKRGESARFVLAGGTLLKQPRFAKLVGKCVRKLWPRSEVVLLPRESVWGAVELARRVLRQPFVVHPSGCPRHANTLKRGQQTLSELGWQGATTPSIARSERLPPTEQRNPRSRNLDKLPIAKAIELMLFEDAKIARALLHERRQIERGVRLVVNSLKRGGRLFYVGAGTSGRLGVLDASECPPTFRTRPEQVQGIVAGGQTALWQSVEGAEDDGAAGARAIGFRGVNSRDVVVGIAASGRTPFVWGALLEVKRRRAKTILLTFNPFLEISRSAKPDLVIAPNVGPEVLTGSTRLKAGTATKLVLNMFSTLAMVKLGKVISNLMVDLNPSNLKLRDRAVRMVKELTGVDDEAARIALEEAGWVVKNAVAKAFRKKARRVV